jgi:hypothetical protein
MPAHFDERGKDGSGAAHSMRAAQNRRPGIYIRRTFCLEFLLIVKASHLICQTMFCELKPNALTAEECDKYLAGQEH